MRLGRVSVSQSDLLKIAVHALALLQERDAVAVAFRTEGADRVVRLGLSKLGNGGACGRHVI